jgi:hypothetical protein
VLVVRPEQPAEPEPVRVLQSAARLEIRKAAALEVSDPARANKLSAAVDRALVDQAVALAWSNEPNRVLVSGRVGNYQSHALWGTILDQLWVR